MPIIDALKTAEEVLVLQIEELAWILLEHLKANRDAKQVIAIYKGTFGNIAKSYPDREREIGQALMEAWMFLETHGLIVPLADSTNSGGFDANRCRVSRQGEVLQTAALWQQFVRGYRLPQQLLHSAVMLSSYGAYLRGDYDGAVRNAFVALEDALRIEGKRPLGETGVEMAGKLYGNGGPLRDSTLPPGEADGVQALFRGAFGFWRNPVGHRLVNLSFQEAGQLLVVVSNLLAQKDLDVARAKTQRIL